MKHKTERTIHVMSRKLKHKKTQSNIVTLSKDSRVPLYELRKLNIYNSIVDILGEEQLML